MIRTPPATAAVLLALLAILAAFLPLVAGPYAVKLATRILATAIFVLSLDLLVGVTGLVSFGHAAFFGIGAYAVWFVSPADDGANPFLALGAGIGLAALAALIIGLFAVRTRGFYFIMVTLAASQMLFALFHDTRIAGGSDGASITVKPYLAIGSTTLIDFQSRAALFWCALGLLVALYLAAVWLVKTPFGRGLQGIRANESRMGALGFNVYWYKLAAFVIAGAVAGLAGALFASIDGFVPPEVLAWKQSGLAIMMLVLGGVGTLYGSVFGAIAFALIEEALKSADLVSAVIAGHWPIPMGLILIAATLGAPKGLAGLLPKRRAPPPALPATPPARKPAVTRHLSVNGIAKRFGGLVAVDQVTLAFEPNRVHAVIGPNGAGKTTFTNLLSGALPASTGQVWLDDEDFTPLKAHARARRGIGRSFQRTNVFLAFSVYENCLLAAQARRPQLRLTTRAGEEDEAVAFALGATGLGTAADRIAGELSHGEQRQLEIAMLIASGAKILLLDEPLAGMGAEETKRVMALLRDLTLDHTIIVIEHDLDAVFSTADTISVLVYGRLLAHGAPDQIRRDPAVREAYLGNFGMAGRAAQ